MMRRALLITAVLSLVTAACSQTGTVAEETTVDATPPTTATIVTTTTIGQSESTTAAAVLWMRVGADTTSQAVGLFDLAQTPSGLVSIGFAPGKDLRQDGYVFVSEDPDTWMDVGADDSALTSGTALLYAVTAGGPGYVVVGMSCADSEMPCLVGPLPTVWTSADGVAWDRQVLETDAVTGALTDVLATDFGIVASGQIREGVDGSSTDLVPAIWLSDDGIEWLRVWTGSPTRNLHPMFPVGVSSLVEGLGGELVGVGSAVDDTGANVAAVWRSPDGVDWERIDVDGEAFVTETGTDVSMVDVAYGSGGYVAVGTDGGLEPAVWTSPDGRSWFRSAIPDQVLAEATSFSAVVAEPWGFLILGPQGFIDASEHPITVWPMTAEGSWLPPQVIGRGYGRALLVTDTATIAVGAANVDDTFTGAIWTTEPVPLTDGAEPHEALVGDETARPPIEVARSGLSCAQLLGRGYDYTDAVVYWAMHNKPDTHDPDADGMPCETEYPRENIRAVFGESGSLSVHITDHPASGLPFEAEGPAVDAGLVCATGTAEYIGDPGSRLPNAYHAFRDLLTCADDTGSLTIHGEVIAQTDHEYGVWSISSGTGHYTTLVGGGVFATGPITSSSWGPTNLTGRVNHDP